MAKTILKSKYIVLLPWAIGIIFSWRSVILSTQQQQQPLTLTHLASSSSSSSSQKPKVQLAQQDRRQASSSSSATVAKSTDRPNNKETTTTTKDAVIVDILSIGSQHRLEFQRTQLETFGQHVSVRNFFVATETVDADPHCEEKLTLEDTLAISNYCRSSNTTTQWPSHQWQMAAFQPIYIPTERLLKNPYPSAWICAQARPIHALYQLQQYYYENDATMTTSLPHYLIVLDDDSYYHMPKFINQFSVEESLAPRAIAGCRMKAARHLTFPLGGFGFIWSLGTLKVLFQPHDWTSLCPSSLSSPPPQPYQEDQIDMQGVCHRLKASQLFDMTTTTTTTTREQQAKKSGSSSSSMVDLFQDYVSRFPFTEYRTWGQPKNTTTTGSGLGYCLHSDMATALMIHYLVQDYTLPSTIRLRAYNNNNNNHDGNDNHKNNNTTKSSSILLSEFRLRYNYKKCPMETCRNICRYETIHCTVDSEACHYVNGDLMKSVFQEQLRDYSNQFKTNQNPQHDTAATTTTTTIVPTNAIQLTNQGARIWRPHDDLDSQLQRKDAAWPDLLQHFEDHLKN